MKQQTATARFDQGSMDEYWKRLSRTYLDESVDGYEVVCFAGMPDWFNRFMHRYQMKAFERLVRGHSFAGCRVLDMGTGLGRWARWYASWPGASVVGIDIDEKRLARASALGGGPTYEVMSAVALEFDDATFDAVNSVTVLQHLPYDARLTALREIARVLRPGGRAIVFENSDPGDDAPHVFPWPQAEWLTHFDAAGLRSVRIVGDQYVPLIRVLKRGYGLVHKGDARPGIDAFKQRVRSGGVGARVLRAAVGASYPLEEVCRYLPARFARINGFLLEKAAS